MTTLQMPMVHLNGTGKDSLLEQLSNASDALNDAYAAIKQAVPNGRDYYPLGPAAMQAATDQHFDRLRRLDAIKAELDAMAEHIYDA
jgi:hypothetical protein